MTASGAKILRALNNLGLFGSMGAQDFTRPSDWRPFRLGAAAESAAKESMGSVSRAVWPRFFAVCAVLVLVLLGCGPDDGEERSGGRFRLTVLHNNDGESQLINAGPGLKDFGGVARFTTLLQRLRSAAEMQRLQGEASGVIVLSSGDNFLAGPEFDASLNRGMPYFDSQAMNLIGYDAIGVGNHEFDLGPDVFANFIEGTQETPFVTANLDFAPEPRLRSLEERGRIQRSTVVNVGGKRVGVIGATTPQLPHISRTRNVKVFEDLPGVIQREVDALQERGIDKIILLSHLQSIREDIALASQLRGVDIIVAGGGNELLANEENRLIPDDKENVYGPYPMRVKDASGQEIPVVTTNGDYRYVGRLIVLFDPQGNVLEVDPKSGPVRVAGPSHDDAVAPDPQVEVQVVEPVQRALAGLARNVIARTEVPLDGRRIRVRTRETNEGDLIADALLVAVQKLAPGVGMPLPDLALLNGGSIRNNSIIPPGDLSELDLYDMLPFPDVVTLVSTVSPKQLKELLENAVSRVEYRSGRFPQIAGFRFRWRPGGNPQRLGPKGDVASPGNRVVEVMLDNGIVMVRDGAVVPDAPDVTIATSDFLARGGDQYPFGSARFVLLGETARKALSSYVRGQLGGRITSSRYPEEGLKRIIVEGVVEHE